MTAMKVKKKVKERTMNFIVKALVANLLATEDLPLVDKICRKSFSTLKAAQKAAEEIKKKGLRDRGGNFNPISELTISYKGKVVDHFDAKRRGKKKKRSKSKRSLKFELYGEDLF